MNLLRIKFSLALCFVFYALSAQFSFDTSNIYSQFKKWDNYFDGKKKINSKSEELIQEGGIYDQYMHERMFWEPRLFPHGSMNVYAKQMKTYHTLYPNNNSIKKGAKLSQGTLSPSLMSLPGQWRELGPNTPPSPNSSGPIYNPQSLGIGPVEFIRLSPFNNGELLCGSTTGGLFYSANNGDNWANAGTDTQWIQSGCKNAAFDANFVNNWVAVSSGQAENGSTNIRYTGGVYRTLDKGTSWTKIADYNNLGGINTILNKVILPKSLSKKAFVATSIGLYKTDDYTLASPTWTQIITNANVYDIEFEESSGRLYAALTPNGLYPKVWYSTNAGAGFTALPDPVFTDGVSACYLMNIELSNAAQGKIFCLYVRPKDEYGNKEYSKEICSYNFSTNLWDVTILTDGLNSLKADLRYSQGEGFAVDQFNANIVYLNNYTGYAIFNIQTITWVNKDDKICNFHPDIEYILSNPFVQNQLWVCTHGGPYKISNSQTFEYKVNGLGVAEALGGDQAESDPSKMAVSLYHDGVLRTTSPYNTSWNPSWGHALNEAVLDGITASISNKHPNIGLTSGQASYEHCWSNDGFISTSTTTNSGEWSSYLKINQHDDNIAYFQSGGGTTIERTFKLTQGPTAFLRETITPSNMISFFNSYNITGVTSTSYRTLRFYMPSNYSNYLYVHILVDQNANSWNDWNKMYLMRTKIADNPSAAAVQNSWEMLPMPVNGWISKLEFDLENPEIVYFFNSTSW
ncbi:MAG: hypothetical protein IT235_02845, partial [Bacteroidia bacterium]|nr:hypothetical protein [Bacteroidia bacterium]